MTFNPFGATIGNLAPPLPVADGGTGAATAAAGLAALGGLVRQVGTVAGGFALQNATPTILTWTPPNDGAIHTVMVSATLFVTVAETGGQVNLAWTDPAGNARSVAIFTGGNGIGQVAGSQPRILPVQAGAAVSIVQNAALTAGAASIWAEIWGA